MTAPHVLFVAAALFLGAGVYAAFSAPLDESQGVTWLGLAWIGLAWLGLAATLIATVTAAVVAGRCAIKAQRASDTAPPRSAIASLGVLAACLGVAAIAFGTITQRLTARLPDASSTLIAPDASSASPTTFTITPVETHPADLTYLVFALAFSAGVAILAALVLAFLRVSESDGVDKPSSAPAA